MQKIIEKLRLAEEKNQYFYSFEFFPPKTDAGVENLLGRLERMAKLEPTFIDVTWGAGGSTAPLSLRLAAEAQNRAGVQSMLHLTCAGLTLERAREVLNEAKDKGICNLLILRGDPIKGTPREPAEWDGSFRYAGELLQMIRKEFGDAFCIAVAGHPEGHPDSTSQEEELAHLKAKVDAGADFILTQFFYDVDIFLSYVAKCREAGIICPIIPGIMPIQNYSSFVRMTSFCGTRVPPDVMAGLAPIKADDEAVKQYGIDLAIRMCTQILESGLPGLHFYTLNLERSVREVIEGLSTTMGTGSRKELPWRPAVVGARTQEVVRPINWANRPKSYILRTELWDEFPNGRWGDLRSPAFGELTDTHFADFPVTKKEDRKAMWGEAPQNVQEVYEVFARYVEGKVPYLPWCESSLQNETMTIQPVLASLNRHGFLTINSQPKVNGARSTDRMFGWGGPNGRVYQKAYVECFCSPSVLPFLMEACKKYQDINVFAVNCQGQTHSIKSSGTTALTWGVFPNREIIQPTIFDPEAFTVWKDEAFQLWIQLWASLYDEDSISHELLYQIHDSFFLVAVVDNDFVDGDLWSVFEDALQASRKEGNGNTPNSS